MADRWSGGTNQVSGPSKAQMHEMPSPSDHDAHDLLAVAALADREAAGEEADRARAQIAACPDCAALHADLVNLASATRQLPPVERPRDFQLRPTDAQRLHPNLLRRLFGSFGTARDGFSRPLAMGLTTLGLAGLMLGVIPGTLSLGGATNAPGGAAPELQQAMPAASEAPAAGAPAAEAPATDALRQQYDGASEPQAPGVGGGELEAEDASGPVAIAGEPDTFAAGADEQRTEGTQLLVISGTMLIVGLGLFALRWTSRRFG